MIVIEVCVLSCKSTNLFLHFKKFVELLFLLEYCTSTFVHTVQAVCLYCTSSSFKLYRQSVPMTQLNYPLQIDTPTSTFDVDVKRRTSILCRIASHFCFLVINLEYKTTKHDHHDYIDVDSLHLTRYLLLPLRTTSVRTSYVERQ